MTPCQITAEVIPDYSIGIGNKLIASAHAVFYYKNNVPATDTACGPIIYELVGGDTAYLSYNAAARVFTLWPKSTAYQASHPHILRVKPTNYPSGNDVIDIAFNAIGTTPCATASYTANRMAIEAYPST
jgi:hypothetical protein